MLELGKVVPVVPVVMKADTMTIREAAAYRQEVYDKIHSVRFDDRMGDAPTSSRVQYVLSTGVSGALISILMLPRGQSGFCGVCSRDVNISRPGDGGPDFKATCRFPCVEMLCMVLNKVSMC